MMGSHIRSLSRCRHKYKQNLRPPEGKSSKSKGAEAASVLHLFMFAGNEQRGSSDKLQLFSPHRFLGYIAAHWSVKKKQLCRSYRFKMLTAKYSVSSPKLKFTCTSTSQSTRMLSMRGVTSPSRGFGVRKASCFHVSDGAM